MKSKKHTGPKVLLLDIETSPLLSYTWNIWQQDIGLNQIQNDWAILSWSAKWLHDPASKVMYQDNRNSKDIEDDKKLLKGIWKLLDDADVIVTQNGKSFDEKKLNARFIINGYGPPSPYQHIDTKRIASKKFAFTSKKLEYMADVLNLPKQKSKHKKFPGFELWKECLKGNKEAWDEMKHYNIQDVLVLEDLYLKLRPWDNGGVNFSLYVDDESPSCTVCNSKSLQKAGTRVIKNGKFQRYQCNECGTKMRGKQNLMSLAKRKRTLVQT